MRAIAPRWCAAAAPIRREIAAAAPLDSLPLRRRRHPRLLSAAAAAPPAMGSLSKEEDEEAAKGKAPAVAVESLPPPPPPQQQQKQEQLQPPEKPLPGDCCGSGCVRCVWDVYYEELEAYQKSLSASASAASNAKGN